MKIAKIIANIIINDLLKHANEQKCKVPELKLEPYDIWWLALLIEHEIIDRTKASKVIDHFVQFGGEIKEIITQLDLWPTLDNRLEELVDKILEDNPKAVKEILAGKKQALGFLMGKLKQVDKNIDSKEAMMLLKEKIQ